MRIKWHDLFEGLRTVLTIKYNKLLLFCKRKIKNDGLQGTWDGALAGRLVIGAGAAVALFQERPREGAFSTVEKGLDSVPPERQGS